MRQLGLLWALTAISSVAVGQVKVETIAYHGWAGSYRISNASVDVVVVPAIGRVMRYGFVGQDNLLWENPALAGKAATVANRGSWSNFGGDKVWPAPQSDWNWPPDPDIDGAPWKAESMPNGVRISSPVGRQSHVRFVREITLADNGTEVSLHTQMFNLGKTRRIGPWQVTQVDNPYSVFLPTLATPQMPNGWRLLSGSQLDPKFHEQLPDGLRLRIADVSYKFGAFSRTGEITSSKGNVIFHDQTKTYDGAQYPDGGSALEVYLSSGALTYAELELLAPLTRMENEEVAVLDATWRLTQAN